MTQGRDIIVHAMFQPLVVVESMVRLATLLGALVSSLHPTMPVITKQEHVSECVNKAPKSTAVLDSPIHIIDVSQE